MFLDGVSCAFKLLLDISNCFWLQRTGSVERVIILCWLTKLVKASPIFIPCLSFPVGLQSLSCCHSCGFRNTLPCQGVPVKAKNWVSVHLPFSYSNYSHENNLCNCSASAQSEFTFHQNPIVSTGRWKLKIVSTKIC